MNDSMQPNMHFIERDMRLLQHLPAVALSPSAAARLQARIVAEARGLARQRLLRSWLAPLAALAAGLVLVAFQPGQTTRTAWPEPELRDWELALEHSHDALAALVGDDALRELDDACAIENELDELMKSLDAAADGGA